MRKKNPTSKDYLKIVEWSDEDSCFIGSAPPLVGRCCHGNDEAKVYKELCKIVEEWIAIYAEDRRPLPDPTAGRRYSGKFVVRVGADLHKLLSIRARAAGESLNAYCAKKLAGSSK